MSKEKLTERFFDFVSAPDRKAVRKNKRADTSLRMTARVRSSESRQS